MDEDMVAVVGVVVNKESEVNFNSHSKQTPPNIVIPIELVDIPAGSATNHVKNINIIPLLIIRWVGPLITIKNCFSRAA